MASPSGQIAREFDHSRITIRKALKHPEPRCQRLGIAPHRNSVPFTGSSTRSFWTMKPRRPSSDIPRRRCSVGCATNTATAAATPRCNAMCSSTAATNERPSFRWGTCRANASKPISVTSLSIFPEGRRLVPFLVTTWAYSNYPFVLALPFERTEAILEGMVRAFEFFGCIPKEVWWDNPKTVATLILQGRNASSIHDTPPWPTTTSSIRSSACQLGATKSPMPRTPLEPCNGVSPPPSRA